MANRHTLACSKLTQFAKYLTDNGWKIEPLKGDYEILRARKPNRQCPLIIYTRHGKNSKKPITHLTVLDRDMDVVRDFLKGEKQ